MQFWLQKRQEKLWKENIEVIINVFPDKQALDNLYTQILEQANQQQAHIASRSENGCLLLADVASGEGQRDKSVAVIAGVIGYDVIAGNRLGGWKLARFRYIPIPFAPIN